MPTSPAVDRFRHEVDGGHLDGIGILVEGAGRQRFEGVLALEAPIRSVIVPSLSQSPKPAGPSVGRLTGPSVGRLTDPSVGRLTGHPIHRVLRTLEE